MITIVANLSATSQLTWTAPAGAQLLGQGDLSTTGGGDVTTITDNSTVNSPLLNIYFSASGKARMAGFTVVGGSGLIKDNGIITVHGPATLRIDHVHISTQTYSDGGAKGNKLILFGDRVYGVLDHSILDLYGTSSLYFLNGSGPDGMGNTSWASDTNFGASSFFFVEDNTVNGLNPSLTSRVSDSYSGSRVVIRFNTLGNTAGPEIHATGHSGDDRGARAQENYRNHFVVLPGQTSPSYDLHDASSGTALVWGNMVDANALKNGLILNVTRKNNTTYNQVATPNGWGYCGTAFNGIGSNWDQQSNPSLGYACIDQAGRGKGDLLTGYFPNKVNSTTGTITEPHQAIEPVYVFMNTFSPAANWGGAFYSDNSLGRIVADRDYYTQASGENLTPGIPFNGTTGTGWGVRANRPTSCTSGVVYWSTDQGSWNSTGSGGQGVLDKCTATNTWTNAWYTPYAYPHPLISGGDAIAPTVTLSIVSSQ